LNGFAFASSTTFLAFGFGFSLSVFDFLQLQFLLGGTFGFLFVLFLSQSSNVHTTDGTGEFLYTACALKGSNRDKREKTKKGKNKRSAVVDGKKEKTYSGPTGTKASGQRVHQHTYFFLLSVVHVFLVKTSPGLCPGQLLWLFSLFVHRFGFFGAQPERLPVTSAAHGAVSRVDTGFREGT
jgi:hypothetical protein